MYDGNVPINLLELNSKTVEIIELFSLVVECDFLTIRVLILLNILYIV